MKRGAAAVGEAEETAVEAIAGGEAAAEKFTEVYGM